MSSCRGSALRTSFGTTLGARLAPPAAPRAAPCAVARPIGEHRSVLSVLLPLIVVSWPDPGTAPVVAVFAVEQRGASLSTQARAGLTDYVSTRLAASGRARVVPQAELKRALAEQKKASYEACYDESCQLEIGREVAAQQTLATRIQKLGGVCVVSLTVFDLTSAASVAASTAEGGCTEAAIFTTTKSAVAQLVGTGAPSAVAPPAPSSPAPPTVAPPAPSSPAPARTSEASESPGARVLARELAPLVAAGSARLVVDGAQVSVVLPTGALFLTGRAALRDEGHSALGVLLGALRAAGARDLVVAVHTDNRGAAAYNQQISEARARAVADALSAAGWPGAITTEGYGQSRPVTDNATESGRAQNRRVEVRAQLAAP